MNPCTPWLAGLIVCAHAPLIFTVDALAAPAETAPRAAVPQPIAAPTDVTVIRNIDGLVSAILERPLFSSSRARPEVEMANEQVVERAPPQLQARLTGVIIGPDGREALFQREGAKPTPVNEGDEIDGWTVSTIRNEQVVLTSEFGDQVVTPTRAARVTRPRIIASAKKPAPISPKGAAPAKPGPAAAQSGRQK